MIPSWGSSWLFNKFSLSTPSEMFREQYGECRFWLMLGCRWQTYSSLTWEEEDCDKVLALCLRTDFLICFDPRFIKIAMDITKNNVNPTDIPMAALSVEVSPSRGYSDIKKTITKIRFYKTTLVNNPWFDLLGSTEEQANCCISKLHKAVLWP